MRQNFQALPDNGKKHVCNVQHEQKHTFGTFQGPGAKQKHIGQQADKNKDSDIVNGCGIHCHGMNDGRNPQDKQQIKDIGADHISYGKSGFSFPGGDDGGYQFREGCADCNNCESDQGLGHAEESCNFFGAVYNNLPACDNQYQA